MSEAIENAILNLPEDESKKIVWVCYNEDMIEQNRSKIAELRGEDFAARVTIISGNSVSSVDRLNLKPLHVYYSPDFFAHRGNGAN